MSYSTSADKSDSSFEPSFWGLKGNLSDQKRKPKQDRFVPDLVGTKLYNIFKDQKPRQENIRPSSSNKYTELLEEQILKYESKKILRFTGQASKENNYCESNLTLPKPESEPKKTRTIPSKPYKELHAPSLRDDFYLNLIDWSSSNQIGAGLKTGVVIWSGSLSRI